MTQAGGPGPHTGWALKRLARERISVEVDDWFGNRRAFTASGYGQQGSAAIEVTDATRVEALLPWMVGAFAPVIEAVGRRYAGRLLSDEWATAGASGWGRLPQTTPAP